MTLPDRTPAQRARDDEDHRLALCGLTPDVRSSEELEDYRQRHYDFQFLAPGSARARFPLGAKRGQVCEEDPATPGLARLAPPFFQT